MNAALAIQRHANKLFAFTQENHVPCLKCGAPIVEVRTHNGKRIKGDPDMLNKEHRQTLLIKGELSLFGAPQVMHKCSVAGVADRKEASGPTSAVTTPAADFNFEAVYGMPEKKYAARWNRRFGACSECKAEHMLSSFGECLSCRSSKQMARIK